MKATVDRIEDGVIVLELPDGTYIQFSQTLLPEAKEGDIVAFNIDNKETEAKNAELNGRINRIWKD